MSYHVAPTTYDVLESETSEPTGIQIEWRGPDSWAVTRGREVLGKNGKWDFEPLPSSRTDKWKENHRFNYGEASNLAIKAAQKGEGRYA